MLEQLKMLKNRLPGLRSKLKKAWTDEARQAAKEARIAAAKHEVKAEAHDAAGNTVNAGMHRQAAAAYRMAGDAADRGSRDTASDHYNRADLLSAEANVADKGAGIRFNVNPDTGATEAQKLEAGRVMFGSGRKK